MEEVPMKEEQGVTLEVGITILAKYDPQTGVISTTINGKEVHRQLIKLKNFEQEGLAVEWDSPVKYTPINGWASPLK